MAKLLRNRRADWIRIHDEGFAPSLRWTPTPTLLHRYSWKDLHGPPSAPVGESPSHASSRSGVDGRGRLLGRSEAEVQPRGRRLPAGLVRASTPRPPSARPRPVA